MHFREEFFRPLNFEFFFHILTLLKIEIFDFDFIDD